MKWFLFYIITSGGLVGDSVSTGHLVFETKEACESARMGLTSKTIELVAQDDSSFDAIVFCFSG